MTELQSALALAFKSELGMELPWANKIAGEICSIEIIRPKYPEEFPESVIRRMIEKYITPYAEMRNEVSYYFLKLPKSNQELYLINAARSFFEELKKSPPPLPPPPPPLIVETVLPVRKELSKPSLPRPQKPATPSPARKTTTVDELQGNFYLTAGTSKFIKTTGNNDSGDLSLVDYLEKGIPDFLKKW